MPSDDDVATLLTTKGQPEPPQTTFTLEAVSGPSRGKRFVVDGAQPQRVLVGEGPACDVRLGDREVSRRHVALDVVGDRMRVTDLGSTNGTFVDGLCVVDAWVRGGELLRVGASELRISKGTPTQALPPGRAFGRVLGASPEMRRLFPLCERIAASTVPVVIEGETGTGKEALAEAIHESSPRASGPYVVFDCTAVPASLAEAELFGHERGAFTGAVAMRKGVFELAAGGTLLIDEIGDMDLALQPKLLRAVERGEIRRIGGDRPIKVDVRLLAATRRDLDAEVSANRFRDDLFHRLAVTRVELPPLRARTGDVVLLARHFWKELGGHGAPPTQLLLQWEREAWPGNVRELRNTVARHIALGDLASEHAHAAPKSARAGEQGDVIAEVIAAGLPFARARDRVQDEFQRRYLEHVLDASGGDTAKAAQASGIARRYFNLLRSRTRSE